MAAKSFAARLRRSRRFLNGFVAGAVVGAAGAGLTALQFLGSQGTEAALAAREPDGKPGAWFPLPDPGGGRESIVVHLVFPLPTGLPPRPWFGAFPVSLLGLRSPRPV